MRCVLYRSIPGMIAICSNDGLATTAPRSHVPQTCAVLFHSSTTNCCNYLTFLGPLLLTLLPITSQLCSKGSRSGERDGYGRTFTLNGRAHHSASGAHPCYTNHHVYGIKMHISQSKFAPEVWLKKGTALKLDLVFAIRIISSMLNRPQTYTPQPMNYPTKERPKYHVKQAGRFDL